MESFYQKKTKWNLKKNKLLASNKHFGWPLAVLKLKMKTPSCLLSESVQNILLNLLVTQGIKL